MKTSPPSSRSKTRLEPAGEEREAMLRTNAPSFKLTPRFELPPPLRGRPLDRCLSIIIDGFGTNLRIRPVLGLARHPVTLAGCIILLH